MKITWCVSSVADTWADLFKPTIRGETLKKFYLKIDLTNCWRMPFIAFEPETSGDKTKTISMSTYHYE